MCVRISLDTARTCQLFYSFIPGDHQGRRLHDSIGFRQFFLLLCIHHLIGDSRLFKCSLGDHAVRTGFRCKQKRSFHIFYFRLSNILSSAAVFSCQIRRLSMELGMKDIVDFSVLKFLSLSIVPVLYRTVVSGDPAVNLRRLAALRTYILFSVQIAVIPANGIGG